MNLRPLPPQGSALPSCATSRYIHIQLSLVAHYVLPLRKTCHRQLFLRQSQAAPRPDIFYTLFCFHFCSLAALPHCVRGATRPLLKRFTEPFSSAECHVPIFLVHSTSVSLDQAASSPKNSYKLFLLGRASRYFLYIILFSFLQLGSFTSLRSGRYQTSPQKVHRTFLVGRVPRPDTLVSILIYHLFTKKSSIFIYSKLILLDLSIT